MFFCLQVGSHVNGALATPWPWATSGKESVDNIIWAYVERVMRGDAQEVNMGRFVNKLSKIKVQVHML